MYDDYLNFASKKIMTKLYFRDEFLWMKKLTIRKLFNAALVKVSYYLSGFTGRVIHWGKPLSLAIEPTTSCNLRCPECPSGLRSFSRPTGMLGLEKYQQWLEETHAQLLYLIFYFQGEPFLNPQLLPMIRQASDKGIYTATSTNAHYLDDTNARGIVEAGLDRLIISIDGTSQDTYEQYRIGGRLDKVITGTKRVLHWRKQLKKAHPYVMLQFLVVRPNEHQIEEAKALAKSLGVDRIVFKSAQIYDYQNDQSLIPKQEKYSRYKKGASGKYELKHQMRNHCWRLWHAPVITWDGRLLACCFDKDADYAFGKVAEEGLVANWKNKKADAFKQQVLKDRQQISICKNCTEGAKVWL